MTTENKTAKSIETIRYSEDGSITMVWSNGEAVRCPTQEDMDTLPVGDDMTAEEVDSLEAE